MLEQIATGGELHNQLEPQMGGNCASPLCQQAPQGRRLAMCLDDIQKLNNVWMPLSTCSPNVRKLHEVLQFQTRVPNELVESDFAGDSAIHLPNRSSKGSSGQRP